MCLIFVLDFNHIGIVSTDFLENPKYQNSQKSFQWGAALIQTDMTKLTGAFRNCKHN